MTYEHLRERLIESFTRGVFPEPIEFTELQIEAIGANPGVDLCGTFADAPMERSLIRKYDLDTDYEENTWLALALALHRLRSERLEF
jgi:hypothetical protein